ncbi:MAG: prolyl oligopeptidase family serine peptidase [Acidobacteria bacterium]|nr:prolyl oligopeptidase family serine peptidase [Acidobacteriota bacterium]
MRLPRYLYVVPLAMTLLVTALLPTWAQTGSAPTIAQFLSSASPIEVVAARNVDRIAWIAFEEGKRNVYTAAAAAFTPVRLTNYLKDDGVDLTAVRISADGSTVVFVRGSAANRAGWHANPASDPNGPDEAVWAARIASPGVSWRVAEGSNPQLSPDGRWVLIVRDGQIYRAAVTQVKPATEMDRGEKPFITQYGTNSGPLWSPDGNRIAFVSNRGDHSFVTVYHVKTRSVTYLAPSVDFDTNPVWSADSQRVVFTRRPGTPFGQQSQAGGGGIGVPPGPASQAAATTGRTGGGGQGRGAGSPVAAAAAQVPGLVRATFKGGYTQSIWVADAASGEGHEVWHNQPNDRLFATVNSIRWAGDLIVFPLTVGGGRGGRGSAAPSTEPQAALALPQDEWDRYYSLDLTKPNTSPVLLTTTDGIIEDQTSVIVSHDGKTFFYCTNAKDIERRHIWAVPTSGGEPKQVTTGAGIETYPAPLASGKTLATLSATWNMPQSLGIWPLQSPAAAQKIVFPTSRPGFPTAAHVEPQLITTTAPDGLKIPNQLFLPKDIKPGERRPAMIFVHGGPSRQMLLGYHYRYVYHQFYATNQWLAAHGYVVLSVNYRSGVGYGRSFRTAANTEARGNSEYQDVVAGAKYLQSRPDVDPARVGIYGLSYGGLLTAQALARNSDIFAAGVDYAGVHLYGSSLDPNDLSYQSSAISQIDKWKSPVLLIQGDDDRNVAFSQTVGLVQLLRQRDVYTELIVYPDDVHDSLLYSRWLQLLGRMDGFLQKFLGAGASK